MEKKSEWHVTGPAEVVAKAKRLVNRYKADKGIKTQAAALLEMIEAGVKELEKQHETTR